MDNQEVLTADECSELLRVSLRTMRKLIESNEIPHARVGSQVRFLRSEVLDHLRKQGQEREPAK
jgi:excisionase family DNA binding protein